MPRALLTTVLILVVLCLALTAQAAITVTIISTTPLDGRISEGESATISWRIESDGESGDWHFEIGGDGTWDSGEKAISADASGTFSGTTNGVSTITPSDLQDGDGDYSVWLIAVDGTDDTNYDSANVTITLDTPPSSVTGLSAGGGDKRIFVQWDEPEDTDIKDYWIYYGRESGLSESDYTGTEAIEGASPVETGDTTNFTLSGLENGVRYYIRMTAEDEGGMVGTLSEEASAVPMKSMGVTEMSEEEGGCFIATVAFGNIDHPMVKAFRSYRDRFLLPSAAGRSFVRSYYRYGPAVAARLSDRPFGIKATRAALIPLGWYAQASLAMPFIAWLLPLILLLLILLPTASYVIVRVRRRDK